MERSHEVPRFIRDLLIPFMAGSLLVSACSNSETTPIKGTDPTTTTTSPCPKPINPNAFAIRYSDGSCGIVTP